MSRHVEITKDGDNYTVNPNASSGGALRLYSFCPDSGYVFWSPKQVLEIGDTLAGSQYEGSSLDSVLPVLDVKTVAEVRELTEESYSGFDDNTRCYRIYEDASSHYSWYILNSENPNYSSGTLYIDFD